MVPVSFPMPEVATLGTYWAKIDGVVSQVTVHMVEAGFYRCFITDDKGFNRRGPYQFPLPHWDTQVKMWKLSKERKKVKEDE